MTLTGHEHVDARGQRSWGVQPIATSRTPREGTTADPATGSARAAGTQGSTDAATIRILLAEDTHMVRGALVALLQLEPDLRVVAEVDNGDHIEPAALRERPDVAILDIDLPGVDGLTAAVRLREVLPSCRTLILTSLGRPGTLRRALAAHVTGFLLKDAPSDQLADAVRRVARGERVIDSELALAAWDTGDNPLTAREVEVLALAARGLEVAEIADTLFLSSGTVRNYLTNVVSKLNARNRLDAVRIAAEAGWI